MPVMDPHQRNIMLVIEYDGTNYHGWQSQSGSGMPTIQDTLETALKTLTRETVKTLSSGRTDAGVHAFAHAANFKTTSTIPAASFAPALNQLLPGDIRVLTSAQVPEDFHARYSALGKVYSYRILNRRAPSALFRNYAWHVNLTLDIPAMRNAAVCLVGCHDFTTFRSSGCTAKSPIRTIKSVVISEKDGFIWIRLEADSFLQYMVRNITGTLVEVGLGRFQPKEVATMLASRDRTKAGRTAPPQGLYLEKVLYPE